MDKYLENILEAGKVYSMNDQRTIITDRMGPWSNQNLTLAWEGDRKGGHICVSPDEAEILFEHGLLTNVQRNYMNELYMESTYADIREFDGAIVCGVLSPSTIVRKGILEYAKRMGYILEHIEPVEMLNGTKSLTCNEDGTYKITYSWSDDVLEKFNMDLVYQFTQKFFEREFQDTMYRYTDKKFYSSPVLTIKEKEFCVDHLLEKEVFDRTSIDAFREYDIDVRLLSSEIDRTIMLKALIHLAYACDSCPENIYMRYEGSLKITNLNLLLPLNPYVPSLSKDKKSVKLQSGTLIYSYSSTYGNENYTYKIDVPYSEGIRRLMKNFEKLMNATYDRKSIYTYFEPYRGSAGFSVLNKDAAKYYGAQLERELVILDYAISMYQNICKLNYHQMLHTVLEFIASDINVPYREIFVYYYDLLYKNVHDQK